MADRRRRRRAGALVAVAAAAAVVGLTACGSRVEPQELTRAVDGREQPQNSAPRPAQSEPAPVEPAESGATEPENPQPAVEEPEPEPEADAALPADGIDAQSYERRATERHNSGTLTIELSAECVTHGDELIVTLHGPPRAGVSMVIGYSDGQPHGAMNTGESDDEGRFVWPVVVAPSAPTGEAVVLANTTGEDWEEDGGGSADRPFMVAEPGGC